MNMNEVISSIYLDEASTTKPKQIVIDEINKYLINDWYNPSSLYSPSQKIGNDIIEARKTMADSINANSYNEIFFTSGGSESNCWAIQGFVSKCKEDGSVPIVISSKIEHHSILECIKHIGFKPYILNVDCDGFIRIDGLEKILEMFDFEMFSHDNVKILVSIQFANNEIGTIQDIKKISSICHKYNAILHTDAVQAFGKIPIDVKELEIDLMSVSGHKIGCPKGIGFLYINNDVQKYFNPLIYGTQMNGMRGSTENVPYIMGMKKAVENIEYNVDTDKLLIRDYMVNALLNSFNIVLNGFFPPMVLNKQYSLNEVINITFEDDINAVELICLLDTFYNVYVSSGSACNAKSSKPSHVLKAIGLNDEEVNRTIRISFSLNNLSYDIVDEFIKRLKKAVNSLLQ